MGAPRALEASSRYKGFRHGLTVHNAACAECHFDLSAGDRVLAEPEETAKDCAECHVGMRFHWARPMPEGH